MLTFRGENDNEAKRVYLGNMVFMVLGKELPLWSCELVLVKAQKERFWYDFPID